MDKNGPKMAKIGLLSQVGESDQVDGLNQIELGQVNSV